MCKLSEKHGNDKRRIFRIGIEELGKINAHKDGSGNLYDYEKGFDELWVEFGRGTLEGSIGEVSTDRRKKKEN
ncbi:MAG: hypothetical protein ACJAWV_000755 [Flammeovirgaceae bacterium]|jgi:hypothetical protein